MVSHCEQEVVKARIEGLNPQEKVMADIVWIAKSITSLVLMPIASILALSLSLASALFVTYART